MYLYIIWHLFWFKNKTYSIINGVCRCVIVNQVLSGWEKIVSDCHYCRSHTKHYYVVTPCIRWTGTLKIIIINLNNHRSQRKANNTVQLIKVLTAHPLTTTCQPFGWWYSAGPWPYSSTSSESRPTSVAGRLRSLLQCWSYK